MPLPPQLHQQLQQQQQLHSGPAASRVIHPSSQQPQQHQQQQMMMPAWFGLAPAPTGAFQGPAPLPGPTGPAYVMPNCPAPQMFPGAATAPTGLNMGYPASSSGNVSGHVRSSGEAEGSHGGRGMPMVPGRAVPNASGFPMTPARSSSLDDLATALPHQQPHVGPTPFDMAMLWQQQFQRQPQMGMAFPPSPPLPQPRPQLQQRPVQRDLEQGERDARLMELLSLNGELEIEAALRTLEDCDWDVSAAFTLLTGARGGPRGPRADAAAAAVLGSLHDMTTTQRRLSRQRRLAEMFAADAGHLGRFAVFERAFQRRNQQDADLHEAIRRSFDDGYSGGFAVPPVSDEAKERYTVESVFEYGGHGKQKADEACAVCLVDFEEGDGLRTLINCGHRFHVCCIDQWLSQCGQCPICKQLVCSTEQEGSEGESS